MQGYSYDKSGINARLKNLSERDRAAVDANHLLLSREVQCETV